MPQMYPLNWIFLYMFFFVSFYLFNILMYYFFIPQTSKKNLSNKIFKNKLNWKW